MVTDFNVSVTWFLGHGLHLDWAVRSWYELSGQSRHFDSPSYFVPAGQSAKNENNNKIASIFTICSLLKVFTGNIDLLNNHPKKKKILITVSICIPFCGPKNGSRYCLVVNLKTESTHFICLIKDGAFIPVEYIVPGKISCMQGRILSSSTGVHPKSPKTCNPSIGSSFLILLVKPGLPCMVLRTFGVPANISKIIFKKHFLNYFW